MLLLLQQVELDQIYEKSKHSYWYHALILGLFLIQTIIAASDGLIFVGNKNTN